MSRGERSSIGTVTCRFSLSTTVDDGVGEGFGKADRPLNLLPDIDFRRTVITAELHYQASAQLGMGFSVPYLDLETENNQTGKERHDGGFMDPSLYVVWSPWELSEEHGDDPFFSLHNLSLLVGLTLPMADEDPGDAPAVRDAQLGSGSAAPRVGIGYRGTVTGWLCLFASFDFTFYVHGDNTDFERGDVYTWRAGASVTPASFIAGYVLFEATYTRRSTLEEMTLLESGGTYWFVTPGVVVNPFGRFYLDASVAFPVRHHVHEQATLTGITWTIGTSYQF